MAQMTKVYADHLRRLARDGTTADSRFAREQLLAAGKTWHKDVKMANRRANEAAALRGDASSAFLPRVKTTIVNKRPTAAGLAAIQRAKARKQTGR